MRNLMRVAMTALCLGALAGGSMRAQAQDPAAMAKQYAESAKLNAEMMTQYSWKMRVELTLDKETKPAQIYQLRYDADGKLQKTQVTATEEVKKKRGIRGKIQKGKIEDFKEWTEQVVELLKDYMAPSPGTMMDFYSKAAMSSAEGGTVQMSATGFLTKEDKATFWIDKETGTPVRYQFVTTLDGDSIEGNVEFQRVTDGPQYPARVTVSVPAREVTAKIEQFDFVKQL